MLHYIQGDADTLKKYCSPEVIERCKAEHSAYQSMGIFFDNKVRGFTLLISLICTCSKDSIVVDMMVFNFKSILTVLLNNTS